MLRQKLAPSLLAGALSMCAHTALFAADTDQVNTAVDAASSAAAAVTDAATATVESGVASVSESAEQVPETSEATTEEATQAVEQAADVEAPSETDVTDPAVAETETAEPEVAVPEAVESEQSESQEAGEPEVAEPESTQEAATEEMQEAPHDTETVMAPPPPPVMDEPEDETIRNVFYAFRERFPTLPLDDITPGPYPGWYEIVSEARLVYVNEDVSLLFQGSIIDLNNGVDLSEARMAGLHMGLINGLGEESMLVYKAEPASDRSITVFTDINCGYCQLLHSQLDVLLTNGVNVRYLMFPRAGIESESRAALESVWCADDPQAAMTAAKAGEAVTRAECGAPVEAHVDVARKVGLRGTPLIYLDNGTSLPGYREAAVIIEMIHGTEPMTN